MGVMRGKIAECYLPGRVCNTTLLFRMDFRDSRKKVESECNAI